MWALLHQVSAVAGGSGLTQMGARSAESLFTGLLTALGFTEVDVTVDVSSTE